MNPNHAQRILFVCTGNTCRSPLAVVLARRLAEKAGLDWEFSSAGTDAFDGAPLSRGAAGLLAAHGIKPLPHSSRKLNSEIVAGADKVLTMTRAQRDQLVMDYPGAAAKIFALREAAGLTPVDVADPIGADAAIYEACAASIHAALAILIRRGTDVKNAR